LFIKKFYIIFESTNNMNINKLKLAIDEVSVNIYIDNGDDKEPTHIVYWHEDEWLEDPQTTTPAIIQAIHLFYTDKNELLKRLGFI